MELYRGHGLDRKACEFLVDEDSIAGLADFLVHISRDKLDLILEYSTHVIKHATGDESIATFRNNSNLVWIVYFSNPSLIPKLGPGYSSISRRLILVLLLDTLSF